MSPQLTPANAAIRGTRVGASEVAALLAEGHPYITDRDVYARLVHGVYRPSSPLMQMGHELEAITLRLGSAKVGGTGFRRNSRTFVHRSLPLAATPDAMRPGELAEVKIISHWAAEDWLDGVPAHVRAQCQAQMMVTGRRIVHVMAMVEGTRVEVNPVFWDDAEQSRIAMAVADFFRDHVIPCKPPELRDESDELVLTVASVEGTVAVDEGDLCDYGNRLAELVTVTEQAKEEEDKARGALMLGMAAVKAAQVIGPGWVASTSANPSTGKVGLRFTRRKERKAA